MGFLDRFKEKVSSFLKSTSNTFSIDKVKSGLTKTRTNIFERIKSAIGFGRKIDQQLLEEIEEILITADIGIDATEKILDALKRNSSKFNTLDSDSLIEIIKLELLNIFETSSQEINSNPFEINTLNLPHTILVVGVNGVGKTTTIGKLAY
ncbi:MAG: signal recognition particle receptor subunit alpha, partial [Candidatus Kapaibacteriota bacterium]